MEEGDMLDPSQDMGFLGDDRLILLKGTVTGVSLEQQNLALMTVAMESLDEMQAAEAWRTYHWINDLGLVYA